MTEESEISTETFRAGEGSFDLYRNFRVGLMITFNVISLLADLIVAFTILRVKRMRSRTYLIILNWAINDGLFCIANVTLYYIHQFDIINSRNYENDSVCAVAFIDTGFKLVSVVFILVLISTTVMKSLKVTDWGVLIIFYMVGFAVMTFIVYFCCVFTRLTVLPLIMMVCSSIVIIVMVFKEINNCCKRRDPLSPSTVFRLNIARIFIYNWVISGVFLIAAYTDVFGYETPLSLEFGFLSGYLSSFYILVYLLVADKMFRMSLMNALRFRTVNYNVDAAISFAENTNDEGEVRVTLEQE